MYLPSRYTIVSGAGSSQYALVAFDNALRHAGIGDYNLVKVSSILPPNCEYRKKIDAEKGSIVFAAYSSATINDVGKIFTTAVAVAIPQNITESGVIFEYSSECENTEDATRDMCCEGMKNRDRIYSEIKSSAITIHSESGKYVSAISAIVMW
ncbi:pyruvoyl-dependent arginine decarboxylase [Spirochaetia bacterium]|nr:pyruvoyl-dependent arginine decarboxylase [Spirochaetia bacterium]